MINIFEVLSKTFDDYKNNFFKASVLCLIIYWFYERGFYIYSPLDFFAYTASGDSFFTLRFILSSIITLLLGSILIFGVYDYFLKISRRETYGFIMLRKNYNLTITGIFLMIGYLLTTLLFFFMMFAFSNRAVFAGENIYLNEYIKIIVDFIPLFVILFYSLVFFIIIDNPRYNVWEVIRESILLFRFPDILNMTALFILFALLKYAADLTRGLAYLVLIPMLFLFMANYYNELYLRRNS